MFILKNVKVEKIERLGPDEVAISFENGLTFESWESGYQIDDCVGFDGYWQGKEIHAHLLLTKKLQLRSFAFSDKYLERWQRDYPHASHALPR